jgi:peptidoglycan/LPS O-acetylase OafA/YrhL
MTTSSIPFDKVVAPAATPRKAPRVPAFDFIKGALVLIMVLYHWLNYFVRLDWDVYRYLRFLTPSFICVSGFLISNIYFSKYDIHDLKLPIRLAQRGLKILVIFILLNVGISFLSPDSSGRTLLAGRFSESSLRAIFVTGNVAVVGVGKAAAFYILVPIGYLLILSAALVIVSRYFQHIFHAVFVMCLVAILVLYRHGITSGNLELITVGLLGVLLGYIPLEKIDHFARHSILIVLAYLAYTAAITIWNVIYPLQMLGVCLSLLVLYLLGRSPRELGRVRGLVVLLGQYSLYAYIAQIVILQVLRRGFKQVDLGEVATLGISFLLACALTVLAVVWMERARAKSVTLNGMYKAVFA